MNGTSEEFVGEDVDGIQGKLAGFLGKELLGITVVYGVPNGRKNNQGF